MTEGRAVWVTRDRAEAAEARVKVLEAEVKRLRRLLASQEVLGLDVQPVPLEALQDGRDLREEVDAIFVHESAGGSSA